MAENDQNASALVDVGPRADSFVSPAQNGKSPVASTKKRSAPEELSPAAAAAVKKAKSGHVNLDGDGHPFVYENVVGNGEVAGNEEVVRPLSCEHCQRFNLPCDGTAPCYNCFRDGEVCEYQRCRRSNCDPPRCMDLHDDQQNPWDGEKVEGNLDDLYRDLGRQATTRTSHITRAWNEYEEHSQERRREYEKKRAEDEKKRAENMKRRAEFEKERARKAVIRAANAKADVITID